MLKKHCELSLEEQNTMTAEERAKWLEWANEDAQKEAENSGGTKNHNPGVNRRKMG